MTPFPERGRGRGWGEFSLQVPEPAISELRIFGLPHREVGGGSAGRFEPPFLPTLDPEAESRISLIAMKAEARIIKQHPEHVKSVLVELRIILRRCVGIRRQ